MSSMNLVMGGPTAHSTASQMAVVGASASTNSKSMMGARKRRKRLIRRPRNCEGHEPDDGIDDGGPDDYGSSDGHASGEGLEPDVGINDGGPDDYGSSYGIKSGISKLDDSLEGVSDGFADNIGGGDGLSAFPFRYGSRTGDPQAGTRTVE